MLLATILPPTRCPWSVKIEVKLGVLAVPLLGEISSYFYDF
jgi:hypothetical protein